MTKHLIAFTLLVLFSGMQLFSQQQKLRNSTILVYTKNGKGYIHDNIPSAVEAIKAIGAQEKFTVVVSDDPSVFTEASLKKFRLLVFPSTNNDVFDTDAQRLAFRRYIEAGGGFVGLHSVTGTERNWTWFKMLIGCTFAWHAKFQAFTVRAMDTEHPSMQGVPLEWKRSDELYFGKELYPVTHILMAHQISSLDQADKAKIKEHAGAYAEYYPAVWYNHFQGGHVWVSTLGHSKETYLDPVYRNHLLQGLRFIASKVKGPDVGNAFAVDHNEKIR